MQVSRELVTAVVELVKDDYLVLSLPKHNQAVGFAAVTDFNLQSQEGRSPFKLGQQVQARIAALPSAETGTNTHTHTHTHARTHARTHAHTCLQARTHSRLCKAQVTIVTSLFSICMIDPLPPLLHSPMCMHSKASLRQMQQRF